MHESVIFGGGGKTKKNKTMTPAKQREATVRDANFPGSRLISPAAWGNKSRTEPEEAPCHGARHSLCFLNCQAPPVDYSWLQPREKLISAVRSRRGSFPPGAGGKPRTGNGVGPKEAQMTSRLGETIRSKSP